MQCPKCQQEMTKSSMGWLCINCGHSEGPGGVQRPVVATPSIVPPPIAAGASALPMLASLPPLPVESNTGGSMVGMIPDQGASPAVVGMPALPVGSVRVKKSHKVRYFVLGGILLLGGLAAAGYFYLIAPETALAAYVSRTVAAKSATYKVSYTSSGIDDVSVNLTATGAYDLKDSNEPKSTVAIKADYSYGGAGKNEQKGKVDAEIRNLEKSIFVKLGKSDITTLAESFLNLKLADKWFFYDLSEELKTATESDCSKKLQSNGFEKQFIESLPLKEESFKGLSYERGEVRAHYYGEYDPVKAKAIATEFIAKLPAECKDIKDQFKDTSEDAVKSLEDISLSYNLWQGFGGDRIEVTFKTKDMKKSQTILVETSGYNKPVSVEKPTGAEDLKKIFEDAFSGFSSGSMGDSALPVDGASGVSAASESRNTTRKIDLRAIQKGLEEYFISTNLYPVSTALLVSGNPKILKALPVDPYNEGIFVYSYVPSKDKQAYTLKACLEDATNNTTIAKTCTGGYYALENSN